MSRVSGKPSSDLVDVRQVAAATGRSAETVRRWVWSGRLRARKEGRRLLISRRDLDSMLEGRPHSATSLEAWIGELERIRPHALRQKARSAADLVIDDRHRRSRRLAGDDARR